MKKLCEKHHEKLPCPLCERDARADQSFVRSLDPDIAELRAENARLRAALEKIVSTPTTHAEIDAIARAALRGGK